MPGGSARAFVHHDDTIRLNKIGVSNNDGRDEASIRRRTRSDASLRARTEWGRMGPMTDDERADSAMDTTIDVHGSRENEEKKK
jgi:hypothetical protein